MILNNIVFGLVVTEKSLYPKKDIHLLFLKTKAIEMSSAVKACVGESYCIISHIHGGL